MSALDIKIALDDRALAEGLDRAIAAGTNLRKPMGEISEGWMGLIHDRFEQERDPLGVPWAKRRVEPGEADKPHKLLQLSRLLHNAIRPDFGDTFASVGVEATAGPAKYARIHNEGGTILPRAKKALSFAGRIVSQVVMPKRQYIGFEQGERAVVNDVLGDFLRGLFAGGAG